MREGMQTVDPAVSCAKFERELGEFDALASEYRGRGWWVLRRDFPIVIVAMVAPHLHPPAVVCGVRLDYTDYDARPPSVQLVNPLTEEPYLAKDLPTWLARGVEQQLPEGLALPHGAQMVAQQALMQAAAPDEIPFLCLPGVREYHDNPGHSADGWEHHRGAGAGRLVRLLEVIHTYGVAPLSGYNVQPQVTGFRQDSLPR